MAGGRNNVVALFRSNYRLAPVDGTGGATSGRGTDERRFDSFTDLGGCVHSTGYPANRGNVAYSTV